MASPYRFDADPYKDISGAKSRTGLNAVMAGGATSGGEGYRRSALLPGARGYVAPTFGGAPRTDYVPPEPDADDDETPEPAPAPVAPPAPAAAPAPMQEPVSTAGEGVDGGGAYDDGTRGDFGDLVGDISVSGKTVGGIAGGALGGLAFGPIGAIGGTLAGRALGSYFGGDAGGGGYDGSGDPANAQSGASENSAANSGAAQGGNMMGDGTFAEGGWVPRDFKGPTMMGKQGGLGSVTAGKKGGGYMGGYADGGPVMSPDDVNAALFRRAQNQTAPTPEMIQAARVAQRPDGFGGLHGNGMRLAESNAKASAHIDARFGSDPNFRPEAAFLGDPSYLTGAGTGMDDPLTWYYAQQRQRDALNNNPHMIEGAPIGPDHPLFTPRASRQPRFMGAYAGGGSVGGMPHYMDGGTVDELAGPNPPGPDDGFAALDQGEFVVRKDQAQRPDYAPVLEQMNQGTYQPGTDGDDLDLDMGAPGNYPPSAAESATPDDMMQRLAMMPPAQSQALSGALADPMVMSALFALLGPSFMGLMSALQSQGQQAPGMSGGGGMQPPGMLAVSPDMAGMRPPGGGLGAVNA